MKQKVFFPLLVITALLLFSCDTAYSRFPMWQGPGGGRENGMFYAIDFTRNRYYTLTATQLAENDYCTIWVETGANVSVGDAKAVAKTYEEDIYPKMITAFGSDEFNAMEVADSYGNGDGKLCILLLNIRDGFNNVSGAYVAGYFTHNDLQANNQNIFDTWYSNESDMIYLNVKPSIHKPNSPNFNSTIAHEMQHLMNYATSLEKRSETGKAPRMMDLWINEGLSSAAEYLYAGKNLKRHVDWFNDDKTKLIAHGDNFYVWDCYSHIDNEAVLNDYATVYLFFQWLRIQAGQNLGNLNSLNIYRDIILSDHSDYNAVLDVAKAKITPPSGLTWSWDLLLRNWLAANYLNNSTGFYGYKDEETLINVKHGYILINSETKPLSIFTLLPGEAIYTNKTSVPPASGKIKYASLSGSSITDSGPMPMPMPTGGTLLSYNIQTEYTAYTSDWDCYPFSITTTTETNTVTAGVPYRSTTTTHNYPISGGEMLNRKGYSQNSLEAGHSRLITGKKFFNE